MTGCTPLENVSPLGYVLVSSQVFKVAHTDLAYYGVVRQPPFCAPDPRIRRALGLPLEEDPVVAAALEEWFDLTEDPFPTRIMPDYAKACRLMGILSQRHPLEMVFCELAWSPGEEEMLGRFREFRGDPKGVTLFYGYDVAFISCNESAILLLDHIPQIIAPSWAERLNRWGLLDSYALARQLREEATRPEDVFYIYRVHRVEVPSS